MIQKKEQFYIQTSDDNYLTGVIYSKSNPDALINIDVLLIHAFPLTNELFTTFFPEPEQWSKLINLPFDKCNLRFIFPNLPGFGSSPSYPQSPLDLTRYIESIYQLIHHYECQILILGGCSMGGYIALEFLRKHSALVKGLILMDTKTTPDTKEVKENRLENVALMQTTLTDISKSENNHKKNKDISIQMEDLIEKNLLIRKWLENLSNNLITDKTRSLYPLRVKNLIDSIKKQNPKGITDALLAMAGRVDTQKLLLNYITPLNPHTHYSDKYAIKSNPVLIISGQEDKLTPLSNWQVFLDPCNYPNLTMKAIPDAAHLPPIENPEEFYNILFQWLCEIIQVL